MTIVFGKKKPVMDATVESNIQEFDFWDVIDKFWPYINLVLVGGSLYYFGKIVACSQILKARAIGR